MGYWNTNRDGVSFALDVNADGTTMMWGDTPADLADAFVREVAAAFVADLDRAPTLDELIAGLRFAVDDDDDLKAIAAAAE